MAGLPGIVIQIGADSDQARRELNRTNDALTETGDQTTRAGRIWDGIKGPMMGALAGVAAGAVAAAGAMWEFGQAAWEDKQEADKLAQTLGKIPGITQDMIDANEEWITSTMFATHVADTQLREAIGKLTLATGDLTQAQELAALAADVATGANLEFSDVVGMLSKAVGGNTNTLKRQMPWLDANKDGAITLTEAMEGLEQAYGGAAAAAAQNDPWTTLKLIWDELKESLGAALLPLLQRFADWFKDPANQQKVQDFIKRVADLAYQFGEKLWPVLKDVIDFLQSPYFRAALSTATREIEIVWNAVKWFAEWLKNAYDWVNRLIGAVKTLTGMTGGKEALTAVKPPKAYGYAPATAAVAYTAGATRTAAPTVVVNVSGVVTDPEATARQIARILSGSAVRSGITSGRRTA